MKVTELLFLLPLVAVVRVQAFMHPSAVVVTTMLAHSRNGGMVPLLARLAPDDEKSIVDFRMKDSVKKEDDAVATALEAPKKGLTPIQQAFWVLSSAVSYVLLCASATLSLGLMLNLFGFAYQISFDHGIEIETIGKMREINQFRSAVNSRPPSSLPR